MIHTHIIQTYIHTRKYSLKLWKSLCHSPRSTTGGSALHQLHFRRKRHLVVVFSGCLGIRKDHMKSLLWSLTKGKHKHLGVLIDMLLWFFVDDFISFDRGFKTDTNVLRNAKEPTTKVDEKYFLNHGCAILKTLVPFQYRSTVCRSCSAWDFSFFFFKPCSECRVTKKRNQFAATAIWRTTVPFCL